MKRYIPWLGAFLILVVIFGSIYGVAQQSERRGANYPQIQLAEDTARALNEGQAVASVVGTKVDMAKSLAPFVIIYDHAGKAVAGSGTLNGHVSLAPVGILTRSSGRDYYAITWQPRSDVRIAAVSVAANNYYVLSGRSLTEVEKSESRSFQLALIGGILAAIILAGTFTAVSKFSY